MVKKITVEINGTDVEMSVEQARELYNSLAQLFLKEKEYIYPYCPSYPEKIEPWVTYKNVQRT